MNAIISIFFGAVITIMALFYLKREVNNIVVEKNSVLNSIDDGSVNKLVKYITELEKNIDQVNESFYEVTSDLEGKYSLHEKEIELLNEEIEGLKAKYKTLVDLKQSLEIKNTSSKVRGKVSNTVYTAEKSDIINETKSRPNVQDEKVVKSISFDDLNTREKIVFLRSEGLELQQIAKKLNIGTGELKLILKSDPTKR